MNKVLILTRMMLKSSFKINKKSVVIGIIIILSALPLSTLIWGAAWEGYDIMAVIGQQGIILWLAISMIGVAIFFFGIFFVMSVFYFSRDIEMLLPLPLKPWHILGAKFINVLIYEYGMQSVFFLPVIIAYGIKDGGSLLYWFYGIIAFLILPVAPLVFASFINILIMRSFNFVKNKDRMKLIASIAAMVLAIGFNLFIQNISQTSTNPDEILRLIEEGNNSVLSKASDIFIINRFAALSMINHRNILSGGGNILIALAGAVVFVLVFLYLGERFYLKGVIGMSEASTGGKTPKARIYKSAYNKNTQLSSYRSKELKLLFRSPVYFINCVMMNFLWPVFFIIPIFAGGKQLEALGDLKAFGNDPSKAPLIVAVTAGASMFVAASNMISSTAISREGSNIYVIKYLPMSYKTQINAKVQSGIILGLCGIIVALIAAKFLLYLPLYLLTAAFLVSIPCITLVNYTGILIDLKFPKLHWDNEQKAVKQNFNGLLNMMIGVLGGALNIGLTVYFKPQLWSVFQVLVIVYTMASIALYNIVKLYGAKLLSDIQ